MRDCPAISKTVIHRHWPLRVWLGVLLLLGCHRTPCPEPHPPAAPADPTRWPEVIPEITLASAPGADLHPRAIYRQQYKFTTDWFQPRLPPWQTLLSPLKGRPNLQYLEIGVFEGRSLLWVLENVCTHPTAHLTGIDTFDEMAFGDYKGRFLHNVEKSGEQDKVSVITGQSGEELRKLPLRSYDIIYIDGSHYAENVLEDAILSWRLLKPGGLLLFDDYTWKGWMTQEPPLRRPKYAIDTFYQLFRQHFKVLHKGGQVFLQRTD